MLTLILPLKMEMEVALAMAEDLMVMVVVVDQMVMEGAMVKDLLEMEVVMAVDLKDRPDQLVLEEDQAMVDGARVDQEVQEDQQEV